MTDLRASQPQTDGDSSRMRILDIAEELFMQFGYAAVTLRQVAEGAGIRQATVYHHFPQGKESLYVAMVERVFARRRAGLEAAIAEAGPNLEARLQGVFAWLGKQPEIHHMGMLYADLPALDSAHATQVSQLIYAALFEPLAAMFDQAAVQGEARRVPGEFLAGAVIALADGITFSMRQNHRVPRGVLDEAMARLMLDGLRPRGEDE